MTSDIEKLKKELVEANKRWQKWEEEEKTEPGKHALGLNSLGQEISDIEQEIKKLENNDRPTDPESNN